MLKLEPLSQSGDCWSLLARFRARQAAFTAKTLVRRRWLMHINFHKLFVIFCMQMSGLATGGPTSSLEISSSTAYTARVSLFHSKPRLQNTLNNSRDVSLMGPRPCLECLYPPCFLLLSEMIRNCILFERVSTGQPLGFVFWARESVWELRLNEHRPVVSGWISENSIGTCGQWNIVNSFCWRMIGRWISKTRIISIY